MNLKTLLLSFLFAGSAVAADSAIQPDKELNVLTIGNSFSQSLEQFFVQAAVSAGFKVHYEGIVIGGCPLKRHWEGIDRELKNPAIKSFGEWGYIDKLKSRKWDIVSIQQASHDSWNYSTYMPYARNICDIVRKYAPSAEIVIQQTWAYRPDDRRLKEWGFGQEEMTKRIFESYNLLGEELDLRIIPTGAAVALSRKVQDTKYPPVNMHELPVPDIGNDVVGRVSWSYDAFHLNRRGAYLQACVWVAVLWNCDPAERIKLVPDSISADDAKLLREIARDAVKDFKQVKKD